MKRSANKVKIIALMLKLQSLQSTRIKTLYKSIIQFTFNITKAHNMEEEKPAKDKQAEQMIPQKEGDSHEQENTPNQKPEKPTVIVEERPLQQKKKVQLGTLGVQPFIIQSEDQEANFVSCRLGDIIKQGLQSQNLKYLYVRNNLIQVIQGLQGFPNLVELQLYDNKILKIENLQAFNNLEILDLSYNNIKVIENISHLKKLKKIFLLSNKIKKIQNLQFPQLQMLELGSNKIKQIENLQGVSSIKALYLGKNRIKQIKNLEPLIHLEQIALGPNRLTQINEGLLPLKNTLRELYLQQNQISRINNVNELKNLQMLDISYNKVEHLENIDKLSKLECLYLNANKIDDYSELLNLKHNSKLTTISLFGNDVTKEPGYRMKLVELLPQIDDIDGTPMKTSYKIVFGSKKDTETNDK